MNRLLKFTRLFFQYKWEEIVDLFKSMDWTWFWLIVWLLVSLFGWIPVFALPKDKVDIGGYFWLAVIISPVVIMGTDFIVRGFAKFFGWIGSNIQRAWRDSK
jgi:hypothetical protein